MKKLGEKFLARLRVFVAVTAVAVVAALMVAVGGARAAGDLGPGEYYQDPLEGVGTDDSTPGFEWVDENAEGNTRGTGYYRIYNALPDNPNSHEVASGWYYFAQASREHTFDGYLVVLDSDIDFSGVDWGRVNNDTHAYTVGSEDQRFSGTFDGNGHTLSNFRNERDGLQLQIDNGFFGWVNKATIKNINFKDCYVGSTYRGGLVAGYAQDTFFLNILAEDCTTSIVPANNVLNLITNAGISGGTIAGVANGCTLYNCEMRAGRVVTNSTAGVAALGGQPLYMGGLVGQANDAIIEYCRVTDKWAEGDDGAKTRTYAEVKGTYETAVSVANYSEVFVGGIVGCMQNEDTGTKIIDCYSTADVYGKAAIYFGVGLGLGVSRAYPGGIAGIVRADGAGENLIQRVSYAGNLHSYQYNIALLGIPIIETDKYMGGIVSVGGGNVTLDQTYFERSASATENEIPVYQNWTTDTDGPADGDAYGPRDDSYTDRDFWEGCGFDFAGGTLRNVGYTFAPDASGDEWNENHYNKWVMDYTRGIPVHGGSIKASMDFPGSGTVTIGTTSLATDEKSKQSTTNPYDFAVQGYLACDEEIELTYQMNDTAPEGSSWAADEQNQGFRFMGWYGSRGVQVNDIAEDHSLFTTPNSTLKTDGKGLLSERYRVAEDTDSDGQPDVLTVKYPSAPDNPQTGEYADNDLYVAYAQAQVLLHDVDGGIVDKDGNTSDNKSDDWYDYEATINLPTSVPADVNQSGNFIGWTNISNGGNAGYPDIDSEKLATLKSNGQFWNPGDVFTVTEPTNLYPVYSQYQNIDVIYEGHDTSLQTRTGYGTAAKNSDTGDLILSVRPAENSPLIDGTVRFLGWYEYVGDATTAEDADVDPNATWLRVSRGEHEGDVEASKDCFTFNVTDSGVDLTETHIYKARFEYEVVYYHPSDPDGGEWTEYTTVWHFYNEMFRPIDGPDAGEREFLHWAKGEPPSTGGLLGCEENDSFEGTKIVEPTHVVAHVEDERTENRNIYVTSDFPTGPHVSPEEYGILDGYIRFNIETEDLISASNPDGNYTFHGWLAERDSPLVTWTDKSMDATIDGGYLDGFWANYTYWYEAHVTAKVTFHGVPDGDGGFENNVTERRYGQEAFLPTTVTDKYTYPIYGGESDYFSTNEAFSFDTDMTRQGYIFLGWLDLKDPEVSSIVSHIAEAGDDFYLAKSYRAVAAYLMTGEEVCTRPMDLYPVYIEFDVNTTTNIAEANVDKTTYNVPADPSLVNEKIAESKGTVEVTFNDDLNATVSNSKTVEVDYNDAYEATVKVTVDNDQKVWVDTSKEDVYTFTSLSVYRDGELAQTVKATEFGADADSGTLTTKDAITIVAGSSYEFVANYSPVPVMVTYHYNYDGGDGSTESFSTEVGQVLPTPTGTPSFSGYENAFVVGWTEGDANGSPANYANNPTILTPGSDVVTGTMHLWPVYRTGSFEVNSNIDTEAGIGHRGWNKTADGQSAELWAEQSVEAGGKHYTFQGWTTGGDNGEIERTSTTWTLYGNDRFPDPKVTYTAIYAEVSEIRYHDTDGDVIYTASVTADDNRTFVNTTTVDIPQYNEDGTPVIDETTGEQVTKPTEIKTPIDSQAFTAIAAAIDSKNAADGAESYEQFVTWQWVDENGEAHRWGEGDNNFVNQPAIDNMSAGGYMDLYPVTVKLTATDTTETAYTDLTTQLTLADETNELTKAMITLQSSYNQEWLKVHIDEVAYAPSNKTVTTAQTNIPVELYTPGSQIGSPVATDTTREIPETVNDDELVAGDALFTFSGRITITKTVTDPRAAGQTFSFTVSNGTDTRAVSIQMPEESENGTYTGTATINVPFGSYKVTEDAGWAWRYSAELEHWELDADTAVDGNQSDWVSGGEVTVEFDSAISAHNPDGVTSAVQVTNRLANEQWFDGSDYKHNVFGEKGGE